MTSISNTDPTSLDVVKARRLNQHVGAIIASLGGFAFGATLGWNSSASDTMRNILNATGTEIGLIGALINAGAFLGALIVPWLLLYVSRTGAMYGTIPSLIIGWTFICCAGQKVWLLMVGRTICGCAGGVFCVITPIYIAEIAEKDIRDRLLTFFQLLLNCGIMYSYVIAHVINENSTIWKYSLSCAGSCALIALVNLIPESPLYHLGNNNENSARVAMQWYRGDHYNYELEMEEWRRLAIIDQSEKKFTCRFFSNRKVLRSFLACFAVIVTQQLSGINTMIFYALTLFSVGGSGELTASEQCLVVGAMQIASCFLASLLIGTVGRRTLLIASAFLMGLCLILLGWFFKVREQDPEYDDVYSWMPPAWFTLFFASYNLGVGPVSWAILGDNFPMEVRLKAASAAAAFSWLVSLIATMTFGEMLDALGIPKTMWVFAAFCWVGAIFCGIIVTENNGKSLADIQTDFGIDAEPEPATQVPVVSVREET
ncbi:facilitated trehalose transporter Tret1 [Cephus cinctus]|uniref:Facilitated trehalose transporter Tret1 n=1 Tax=Cephus cinctus TaxID=211228 RepID=A0AAJ7R8G3_CEPCN|nr:facilitated trehalose transporter Tret1 [Cephus cinctus]XP_024936221.1 facilitated trehalose transporter Tret1 [Cephus cinctus]